MAEEDDDGRDFDTEMGGDNSGADHQESERDSEVDELEDLSREELYDRLKEANNTAKKYRLRLKRARQGTGSRRDAGRYRGEEDDDRDDDSRAGERRSSGRDNRRGDRERDDRGRSSDRRRNDRETYRESVALEERAIRAEAKTALAAAGIPADRLSRAVRLIDLRSLEFDDDDELIGIEDEIEDLKDEWPELFEKKKRSRDDDEEDDDDRPRRRRVPRADTRVGTGRTRRDRREKSSTEIAAEKLMGFAK